MSCGIEARQRNDDRVRIGFDRNLVRLADVDQKIASLGHSLRYIFRRQIVNLTWSATQSSHDRMLLRFSIADRSPFGANLAPRASENQAPER